MSTVRRTLWFPLFCLFLLFCSRPGHATEPLTVFVEVTGENPAIRKMMLQSAKKELSRIEGISAVNRAELAIVVVSFAFEQWPDQKDQVIYSFAYGINEIGDTTPPVSIPRFITHSVRHSDTERITNAVGNDIDEVNAQLLSLIR